MHLFYKTTPKKTKNDTSKNNQAHKKCAVFLDFLDIATMKNHNKNKKPVSFVRFECLQSRPKGCAHRDAVLFICWDEKMEREKRWTRQGKFKPSWRQCECTRRNRDLFLRLPFFASSLLFFVWLFVC
nr:hypothetical protein [Pandoravirus aubagnensis]